MATKEYNVVTRTRTARSRSDRRAESATGGSVSSSVVTSSGSTSESSGSAGGHSHSNKELLDALQRDEQKYLYLREWNSEGGEDGTGEYESEKAKAGYADEAGKADNSTKWNSKEMSEMMDQPVRTSDDVKHNSVTATETLKGKTIEGDTLTVTENATVGGNATIRGDARVNGTASASKVVTPQFTTPDFRQGGLTGEGGGVYTDEEELTHAEYDYIVARRGLVLSTLTIEEINSIAGGIVASKAHGEVESIYAYTSSDGTTRYNVYLKDVNMFQLFDLVRFAKWDYTNNTYRWAWVPVRGYNPTTRHIDIWGSDLTDGMSMPEVGDKLVQMGNLFDTTRQGFVYITDTGVQCYDGVSTTSLVGKCRGAFGDLSGITDNGKALSGYGVWSDTLYIGTGKSVYETFAEVAASISATNDTLAEYKTEVTSRFDVVAGEMASVQKSVASLQTGGGRNLLLKTNRGVTGWLCLTDSADRPYMSNMENGSVGFDYVGGNTSASYEIYTFDLRPELIIQGRTYTLTVEALGRNTTTGMYLCCEIANNNATGVLAAVTSADNPLVEDTWTKLTFTFTATASGSKGGAQRVRIVVRQSNLGQLSWIGFRNLKLEEGTEPTAYTAAPEDYVDGEISAVRETVAAIEQTAEEISLRVEEANTTLDGKIASNASKITQNATAITTEVSTRKSEDATLSSKIEQTAEGISLKVSELSVAPVNYAHGTAIPVELTELGNSYNKTHMLYDVKGLSGGDRIMLSFIIRLRNIVFDTESAANDTAHYSNGAPPVPFMSLQLTDKFGYAGWAIILTAQTFEGVSADADGYRRVRVLCQAAAVLPAQGYTGSSSGKIYHDITPDIVGKIYIRLDYISSGTETDASGNLLDPVVEIRELKIEKGSECTAWTARTGDLETAMRDTGIDIGRGVIEATADKFRILNNNGMVTAEVDENGDLTVSSVACRYGELSGATTPNMADWNKDGDGVQRWYFPDGTIRAEVGWDAATASMIRKYDENGNLLWALGDPTEFMTYSEPVWSPISLYYCGTDISGVPRTTTSLVGKTYYRKTNTGDASANNTVYKSSLGTNPAVIDDGWYTPPGVPLHTLADSTAGLVSPTRYSRTAYYYVSGKISHMRTVSWSETDSLDRI